MSCWHPLLETDWGRKLGPEFEKPYWAALHSFVERERRLYNVYPPQDEVFAALLLTSCADAKVVILGQDPYHGAGQAHGLAFSVPCGVPVPPSLKNILKEVPAYQREPIPSHGNLEGWARRGVLLLNTTLTVRQGVAGSHRRRGWETFTDEVIRVANRKTDPVVFMLWGRDAQRKKQLIDSTRHTVNESSHPSPVSAWRGFLRSKPFSLANEALVALGGEAIDWTLADCPEPDH
jgi:uracil-DNA glycosylase